MNIRRTFNLLLGIVFFMCIATVAPQPVVTVMQNSAGVRRYDIYELTMTDMEAFANPWEDPLINYSIEPGPQSRLNFHYWFPLISQDSQDAPRLSAAFTGEFRKTDTELKSEIGFRILLIEDHEPARTALTALLARGKHIVLAANSVTEARRTAEQEKIDHVISDIGLPDGNGYLLMQELNQKCGLQGIALTGYGMEQDTIPSKEARFIAHLVNPISVQSLDDILATMKISGKRNLPAP